MHVIPKSRVHSIAILLYVIVELPSLPSFLFSSNVLFGSHSFLVLPHLCPGRELIFAEFLS